MLEWQWDRRNLFADHIPNYNARGDKFCFVSVGGQCPHYICWRSTDCLWLLIIAAALPLVLVLCVIMDSRKVRWVGKPASAPGDRHSQEILGSTRWGVCMGPCSEWWW